MKVLFRELTAEYTYPLSKSEVVAALSVVSDTLRETIVSVEFICNNKSGKLARIVQKAGRFEISVNCGLKNQRTSLQYDTSEFLQVCAKLGGKPEVEQKTVFWPENTVKNYALFLIYHELAHVLYTEERTGKLELGDWANSKEEERWCDAKAFLLLDKFRSEQQN